MNWIKGFALVTCLAMPLSTIVASQASAEDAKPMASTDKKPTSAQLKAYQEKCSKDADTKGLKGKAKSDERKTFRAECIKKLVSGS